MVVSFLGGQRAIRGRTGRQSITREESVILPGGHAGRCRETVRPPDVLLLSILRKDRTPMSLRSRVLTVALALLGSALLLPVASTAAELDGTWEFAFSNDSGSYPRTLVITQDGEAVTAKQGDREEYKGTFKDGVLELSGEHAPPEVGYRPGTLKLRGKLKDGRLSGSATWDNNWFTFKATRKAPEPETE